jgi:release factor glutamine methyltransferase
MSTEAVSLRNPVAAIGHRLWRLWLALRFRLFQRRRHDALVLEEVAGLPVLVLPEVFNPKLFWTGELLAGLLDERLVPPRAAVLDLGTGTGIGAIAAARWAGRVVAVDINPAAERCALFAPVEGERFDVVLFNPPYYQGQPRGALDQAFRAADVPERFAAGLVAHLRPDGHALVVQSSAGDDAAFLQALRRAGLSAEPVIRQRRIGEVLTVYRVDAGPAWPC